MTQRVYDLPAQLTPPGGTLDSTKNDVRIATPVLGAAQWERWAKAVNWLNGHGGQLVACGPVRRPINRSVASSFPFTFYAWPSTDHLARLWTVTMRAQTASGADCSGQVAFDSGRTYDYTISKANSEPVVFHWVDIASSSAAGGVIISFQGDTGTSAALVEAISCTEIPRGILDAAASTVGVHETSCSRGKPIFDNGNSDSKYSIQGVFAQMQLAKDNARRKKLFDWASDGGQGTTITDTSFTGSSNIFHMDPSLQTRHMEDGTTVRSVTVAVYAECNGGDETGELRATMTSGDSVDISLSGASGAWFTGTIDVETDDFSETDLIRGATRDECVFEARKTGTTTDVVIYSISVGEA